MLCDNDFCFWLLDWTTNDLFYESDWKNERIEVKFNIPKLDHHMIYIFQIPWKIPEIAEKKYKYAEAEREIG